MFPTYDSERIAWMLEKLDLFSRISTAAVLACCFVQTVVMQNFYFSKIFTAAVLCCYLQTVVLTQSFFAKPIKK
jgi:hypothetical protein